MRRSVAELIFDRTSGKTCAKLYIFGLSFPSRKQSYLYKRGVALEDVILDRALAKSDLADLGKVLVALQCGNKTENVAKILLDR